MARQSKVATFIATIKWGYSNDDITVNELPEDFIKAREFWASKSDANLEKAFRLIEPYVICIFLSGAHDGNLGDLFDQEMEDLKANEIEIYGLDFSVSNLPRLKAVAIFQNVSLSRPLNKEELERWQDENGMLDSCISFGWAIDGVDEGLDLESWNHSGLDFTIQENSGAVL